MPTRYGRMRKHDVGLIDVPADDHALALTHQLVEIQIEAVLAAAAVGAPEVQRARGHHRGRGTARRAKMRPDMVDLQHAAYVLFAMLAAIDEGVLDLQLGDVADGARNGDAAGVGHGLN